MAVVALEKLGVDSSAILSELGITRLHLMNPAGRVSLEKELQFWKLAFQQTQDPQFALKMSREVPFGYFSLLDYMGASASSLYDVLKFVGRYSSVIYSGWKIQFFEDNDYQEFHLGFSGEPESLRFTAEFTLGFLFGRLKIYSQAPVPLKEVRFRHHQLGEIESYQALFGVTPVFGSNSDSLVFAGDLRSIPCQHADSFIIGTLAQMADTLMTTLSRPSGESDLVKKVKNAIVEKLFHGEPDIESLSRELAMSSRTLQRHLEKESTSLSQLIQSVRKELSEELLLKNELSHEDIAFRLGYSTLSAFNRAFKTWNRMTPTEFKNLRGQK